jgi:16S rRNA processing protein RimM
VSRQQPTTVEVARIVRAHGVRGEAILAPASDVPGRFAVGSELTVVVAGGRRLPVRLTSVAEQSGMLRVAFDPPMTREQVVALRGAVLEVPREKVPPAPPGTYYFFELVGCCVVDRREGELGEVVDLLDDGGGMLLSVAGGGREMLIPFVDRFLVAVDTAVGRIDVDLPDGFVAECASAS